MIDVVGRLPVNTRAETMASGVPSARTSSLVLPNARALVCAKKFDRNSSCMSASPSPSAHVGFANAMKSAGTMRVPWWISW